MQNGCSFGFCQIGKPEDQGGKSDGQGHSKRSGKVFGAHSDIIRISSCIICLIGQRHVRTNLWDVFGECYLTCYRVRVCAGHKVTTGNVSWFVKTENRRLGRFDRVISSDVTLWKGHWT